MKRKASQALLSQEEYEEQTGLPGIYIYVTTVSRQYDLETFTKDAEKQIIAGDSALATYRYKEQESSQISTQTQTKKKSRPRILIGGRTHLVYFLTPTELTGYLQIRQPYIATVIKVRSFQVLSNYPAMELFFLKDEHDSVFNNIINATPYALAVTTCLNLRLFGNEAGKENVFNYLYPPFIKGLSFVFRYQKGELYLSETGQASKQELEDLQDRLYPQWKQYKEDSSIKLTPLTAFDNQKTNVIEFFTRVLQRIIDNITSKGQRYDENIDISTSMSNIKSLYIAATNTSI